MRTRLYETGVGLSRALNALVDGRTGSGAVTLSAGSWDAYLRGTRFGRLRVMAINKLWGDPQHCLDAWAWHRDRSLVDDSFLPGNRP
jgi:hypothetical protein